MVAACVVGRWLCAAVLMGLAVGCVRNLDNFKLKLIQKNINKFVMTNMCTCVILLLLRLAANKLMNIILIMAQKCEHKVDMCPCGSDL